MLNNLCQKATEPTISRVATNRITHLLDDQVLKANL